MEESTPYPSAHDWAPQRFARLIEEWTSQHGALLDGLIALRDMGEEVAVEAVLAVSEVRRLRLAWELWEAVLEGDVVGAEPREELRPILGDSDLEWYSSALWGRPSEVAAPTALSVVG